MKKYTQRELLNEGALNTIGRVAGRAARGLASFISPTLGGLINKGIAKITDLKDTYLTPERAVQGTLKALVKTQQIKSYEQPKELTPVAYQQKKNASYTGGRTRRTLDIGNRSTSNKYYECVLELADATKVNFALTISSTVDPKNPKIFIWKATAVEDITPKPPNP